MDFTYLFFDAFCLTELIYILTRLLRNKELRDGYSNFLKLVIVSSLFLIMDFFFVLWFPNRQNNVTEFLTYGAIVESSCAFCFWIWLEFIAKNSDSSLINKKWFKILTFLPVIYTTISCLLNVKYSFVSYVDESGTFRISNPFWFFFSFGMLLFLCISPIPFAVKYLIKNRNNGAKKNALIGLVMSIVPITLYPFQLLFSKLPIAGFMMVLPCIVYYELNISNAFKESEKIKEQKQQLEKLISKETINNFVISSVVKMYISIIYIDLLDYSFIAMEHNHSTVTDVIGENGNILDKKETIIQNLISPSYKDVMKDFLDFNTLQNRMQNNQIITCEFLGKISGWCEGQLIVANRNNKNQITHIIWAVRSVNKEKELQRRSYIDELTGFFNRRAYEEEIFNLNRLPVADNLVLVSIDVNGLKTANDTLGHAAGDELLKGATLCLQKSFGEYGKIFRTGGDEFIAILYASEEKLDDIKEDLKKTISTWSGEFIKDLSLSCGYASAKEHPHYSIKQLLKQADKFMYENKALYYSKHEIDKRSRDVAYFELEQTYVKVLKVNLSNGFFSVIQSNESPAFETHENQSLTYWIEKFASSGMIKNQEELNEFKKYTDINYLQELFNNNKKMVYIRFDSIINNKLYRNVIEWIPSKEYSIESPFVFMYIKDLY